VIPPLGDTLPGYETSSFYGVGAPDGTPPEIVDLLDKEINAALADPTIKQRLGELGAIPISGDSKEFAAMLAVETSAGARWRRCRGRRRNKPRVAALIHGDGAARMDCASIYGARAFEPRVWECLSFCEVIPSELTGSYTEPFAKRGGHVGVGRKT
jgi:hypothetical protein